MIRIASRILSPSAINMYLSCPRKYYLRYVKGLRTRPSIHLIRGQIVHDTIRLFHRNHPELSSSTPLPAIREELLGLFNTLWKKAGEALKSLKMRPEELTFYHDDSEVMLLHFSHWFFKNNMPCPEFTEARILSRDLGLIGIIDAVHRFEDKTVLVDYKTSKYATITNDIQRQAALYALLYEDKYNVPPDSVWIHFLKFVDDPMPVHVDDELLQYARIVIESAREKTASDREEDYPCTCGGYCESDFVWVRENGPDGRQAGAP